MSLFVDRYDVREQFGDAPRPTPADYKFEAPALSLEEAEALLSSRMNAATLDAARLILNGEQRGFGRNLLQCFAQGLTLSAQVPGAKQHPYFQAEVTLERPHGGPCQIASWRCNCSHWATSCRHVGAVLLLWATDRCRFQERPDLAQALRGKTKEQLVDLLATMARANSEAFAFINNAVRNLPSEPEELPHADKKARHDL